MAKRKTSASRPKASGKRGRKSVESRPSNRPSGRNPDGAAFQAPEPATNEKADPTQTKIFPRNLTARAEFSVAGNPIVTRPEDAVANCYPGLELDVRNLDRRFFPGLVFNFVEPDGAKLAYADAPLDPDFQLDSDAPEKKRVREILQISKEIIQTLYAKLTDNDDELVASKLGEGSWYLDWIEVKRSRISTTDGRDPLTGLTVWRLIRGLRPGPVSIGLKRRDKSDKPVVLHGWRRLYTDPTTGVISGAYQPGELMQGLCSPWQHDFRDCYCHYWASNRPDLVFGDVYPGESVLPDGEAEDPSLNIPLDWMRADRSRALAVKAFGIIEENRPYQFDHYQINHEWQKLNIVLGGREIDSVRLSEPLDAANPFANPGELAEWLRTWLAPLELTLVFEYLYARFSLRDPRSIADAALSGAVALAREYLLLICMSEMQHLRWGNEILWELRKAGLISAYAPIIESCQIVPVGCGGPLPYPRTSESIAAYLKAGRKVGSRPRRLAQPTAAALAEATSRGADPEWRERTLRPLDPEAQQDFINIEHPSGFIDSAYARVAATLAQTDIYPPHLVQLAERIVGDGVQHEVRCITIKGALRPYEDDAGRYLRTGMKLGTGRDVETAIGHRNDIITALKEAYAAAASERVADCAVKIAAARVKMTQLLDEGERLANEKNIGIPFFEGI
jgi:hypothetical protein